MSSRLLLEFAQGIIFLYMALFCWQIAEGKYPKDPKKREAFLAAMPFAQNKGLMIFGTFVGLIGGAIYLAKAFGIS